MWNKNTVHNLIFSAVIWPCSYCSTIAGTRPHFPAVYTSPPSTAAASASLYCGGFRHKQKITNQQHKMKQKYSQVNNRFVCFSQDCFTIIFFRQSSADKPLMQRKLVPSFPKLLMLQSSHFSFSASLTTHHFMSSEVLGVFTGKWSKI